MNLLDCKLCPEFKHTGPIPGYGNENAKVCILGRNPNVENTSEIDNKLDEGFAIAKLDFDNCWYDYVVKCSTPIGVRPTHQCQRICSNQWLTPTLQSLTQLKLIVLLGTEALHYFLTDRFVAEEHGRVVSISTKYNHCKLFTTFHPVTTLHSYTINELFLRDMSVLGSVLREESL